MTKEEQNYCDTFIAKWKSTLSGRIARTILMSRYSTMTECKRSEALRGYIYGAPELSDAAGKTREMRDYIFNKATKLIEDLVEENEK